MRLAEACRVRGMTYDQLCASLGLGGRRAIELSVGGVRAIDIPRLVSIADRLNVSVDWLLGRSEVMELPPKRARQ